MALTIRQLFTANPMVLTRCPRMTFKGFSRSRNVKVAHIIQRLLLGSQRLLLGLGCLYTNTVIPRYVATICPDKIYGERRGWRDNEIDPITSHRFKM